MTSKSHDQLCFLMCPYLPISWIIVGEGISFWSCREPRHWHREPGWNSIREWYVPYLICVPLLDVCLCMYQVITLSLYSTLSSVLAMLSLYTHKLCIPSIVISCISSVVISTKFSLLLSWHYLSQTLKSVIVKCQPLSTFMLSIFEKFYVQIMLY